jgi:hypothetical protein
MTCDFFTITTLIITDIESSQLISTIELRREKNYFSEYNGNSDDSEYEEFSRKHFNKQYNPIIIYINENFTKNLFRDKYEVIINDALMRYDIDIEDCIVTKKKYNQMR